MAKKETREKSDALPARVPWSEKAQELAALGFVLAALFVFVSLVSYDAGDLASVKSPPNDPPANRGGAVGAAVGHWLLSHFGLAAYLVVFLVGFWSFVVFFRRKLQGLYVKLAAAFVAVLAFSTLMSIQPFVSGLSATAPSLGGLYGRGIETALTRDLGIAGTWMAVLLAFCVSIVLATDWMIYRGVASGLLAVIGFARRWTPRAVAQRTREEDEAAREKIGRSIDEERRKIAEDAPPVDPMPSEDMNRLMQLLDETPAAEAAPAPSVVVPSEGPRAEGSAPIPVPVPRREVRNPVKAAAASHEKAQLLPYEQPPIGHFEEAGASTNRMSDSEIQQRISTIENTLKEFQVTAKCVNFEVGPATTTFELELAPGTKCAAVEGREDELTMKLASQVRVVAPIPGKTTVGVEVPNPKADIVRMRPFLEKGYKDLRKIPLPMILGKTNSGDAIIKSLASMPHLMIGGTTGSGKSVCLNTIITTLLVGMSWDEMKLILIDPKKVELAPFADIPHLWAPVVDDARKAAQVLEWLVKEMEERYATLKRVQARNIDAYNKLGAAGIGERLKESGATVEDIDATPKFLPYIVVVIDEMANLMQTARKEVELSISTLAAKARAVGIHLICATQRPSRDVITGLIKANMPSQIAFRVSSAIESRIILDDRGAERLLGKGDMLIKMAPDFKLQRGQCTFTSDEEIRGIVQFLKTKGRPVYHEELVQIDQASQAEGSIDDELFDDAVRVVLQEGRGSTSLLQRKLQVGYSRAARLVEAMEAVGVLGPHNDSKPREILLTWDQWEAKKKQLLAAESAAE